PPRHCRGLLARLALLSCGGGGPVRPRGVGRREFAVVRVRAWPAAGTAGAAPRTRSRPLGSALPEVGDCPHAAGPPGGSRRQRAEGPLLLFRISSRIVARKRPLP